ncbi:MAG: 2-hydroxyacyl-CoA dehydratase subunit D [Candidatus Hodarchaeales archaeon]
MVNIRGFEFFLDNYTQTMKQLHEQGKKLIGYFTNRVPVEIIYALGLHPIRVMAKSMVTTGSSERYIQTFGCSWLRYIFDMALNNEFSCDGLVFSTGTCDSLQNVADIWRKVFPDQWVYNLNFPVRTETESARMYLQNEFENLVQVLKDKFQAQDFNLVKSITLFNQKRSINQKLAHLVSKRELMFSDYAKFLNLGDILPVEDVIAFLEHILENDEIKRDLPDSPSLLVTGGMGVDNLEVWDIEGFEHVVVDDLSFGRRNWNFVVPKKKFLEGLAQAYFERIPDPTAFDMDKRLSNLKNLVKDYQVDGVVLLNTKWCDPEAFEFVAIQNLLKEEQIPYLNLETTPDLSNKGQIQTRLSAFIEMIT